ncbi:hypothetical protein C7212DRAFT_366222 [Tuber magnatum]|uniref:Uncharacterized protein n=1 Tax=Tuber magnatum TaxID=42249 RepID=A0A317SG78_9PEZI|nr:hypothetical protein C7212DRAFT_366222 [Tuber magnatum]
MSAKLIFCAPSSIEYPTISPRLAIEVVRPRGVDILVNFRVVDIYLTCWTRYSLWPNMYPCAPPCKPGPFYKRHDTTSTGNTVSLSHHTPVGSTLYGLFQRREIPESREWRRHLPSWLPVSVPFSILTHKLHWKPTVSIEPLAVALFAAVVTAIPVAGGEGRGSDVKVEDKGQLCPKQNQQMFCCNDATDSKVAGPCASVLD